MKKHFILILLSFLTFAFGTSDNIPEPYKSATLLPFSSHGWYPNGPQLEILIRQFQVRDIIEVGCWLGLSTRHMASHLPQEGKLYAIDHWLGSAEHQPGMEHWRPELGQLYEYFLSNVIQAGLTDKIIPIRMDSLVAAASLDVQADLIYIDANHETAAVYADLAAWHPHLRPHGILCGDDWNWPTVRAAVEAFAQEKGLTIEASEHFWKLSL
ncbi:MAG: class I SAM-dependent methyltransferase [Verrucomicrobia bacterium]|nr:class I SAM-dependent methyltransferase [Verrucomicrobiota bacterium]